MAGQEADRKAKRDRNRGQLAKTHQSGGIFFHGNSIRLAERFLDHVIEFAKPFIDHHIDLNLDPDRGQNDK